MYHLDLLIPDHHLLPPSCPSSPNEPLLPWDPSSTWTFTISLISYWSYRTPTPYSHHKFSGSFLPIILPLHPLTIWVWGACSFPCCSVAHLGVSQHIFFSSASREASARVALSTLSGASCLHYCLLLHILPFNPISYSQPSNILLKTTHRANNWEQNKY